jgi:hypothetical protein
MCRWRHLDNWHAFTNYKIWESPFF